MPNLVITKIFIYDNLYVFDGKESIVDIIIELSFSGDLENPGKLPVQEVLEGNDDCVLKILAIFSTIYVFEIKKSIADISTELPCSGDFENLGKLPGQEVLENTDDCVL